MDVILIRHGKAGDRDAERWPDDDQRPLTEDGIREQQDVAAAMRNIGIEFDFLVTSPLVRARQTADIVAGAFTWREPPQEADVLGHNCSPTRVVQLLAKYPPDGRVALVGHEPDLSRLAAQLISPAGDTAIELKKGGVIGVRFEGPAMLGKGTLSFLLKPSQLRKVAKNSR